SFEAADEILAADLDAVFESLVAEEPTPTPLDRRSWAERTLADLTIAEKAGQLIMPWVLGDFAPEGSGSHERMLTYIEEQG
ncbi:MAG: hypothetical protein ACKVIN_07580, partial [Longimicrobiales bacterium]